VKATTNTLDVLEALPANAGLLEQELVAAQGRVAVLRKLLRVARTEAAKKARLQSDGHPAAT
jgi:hypothetical protein